MEAGRELRRTFEAEGVELTVKVLTADEDDGIRYRWSASGVETVVDIELEEEDGWTIVNVTETGWPPDKMGIARLPDQTQGWVYMLLCLEAYLEHGITLRSGSSRATRMRHQEKLRSP